MNFPLLTFYCIIIGISNCQKYFVQFFSLQFPLIFNKAVICRCFMLNFHLINFNHFYVSRMTDAYH